MTYVQTPDGQVFETESPQHWRDCTVLPAKKGKALRAEYCRAELRKLIQPGDTVYCILRHRSASGMSRRISLAIIADRGDGSHYLRTIDQLAADAAGFRTSRNHDGLVVSGCGMDMGFHTVYSLGRALFPDGFGVLSNRDGIKPQVRPLTPEKAAAAVAKGYTFSGRNRDASGWDNDGGYALVHSWV